MTDEIKCIRPARVYDHTDLSDDDIAGEHVRHIIVGHDPLASMKPVTSRRRSTTHRRSGFLLRRRANSERFVKYPVPWYTGVAKQRPAVIHETGGTANRIGTGGRVPGDSDLGKYGFGDTAS